MLTGLILNESIPLSVSKLRHIEEFYWNHSFLHVLTGHGINGYLQLVSYATNIGSKYS